MGIHDSSKTRVRPVFRELLERDPSGADWIAPMLAAIPQANRLGSLVLEHPGSIRHGGHTRFEYPAPPSDEFLRWLIRHPAQMMWPRRKGVEVQYGAAAQRRREQLFGRRGPEQQHEARAAALAELDEFGGARSAGRWWAFEGFTKVDFCLQTEELVLFVEGKRKDQLTRSNDWYKQRNQLVRNMEVVGAVAGDRACGVVLCTEHPVPSLDQATLDSSTPHLRQDGREVLARRFLGQITWATLCQAVGIEFASLPDTASVS